MIHYAKLWKQAAKRWYSERRRESLIWLRPEGEVLEKLRSKAVEEALGWIHSYQDANESLMNENESLKSELASCATEMRAQYVRAEKAESARDALKCCGNCAEMDEWTEDHGQHTDLVHAWSGCNACTSLFGVCAAWKGRHGF